MKKSLYVGAVMLSLISTANAAERAFSPYIGVELGSTSISSDFAVFDEEAFTTFKGNLGFRYGKYIGAEVSYETSAENDATIRVSPTIIEKDEAKYSAFGIDVLGYLPLNDKFDLIGSFGVAKYSFDSEWKANGDSGKVSEDKTSVRIGLGAQFNLNKNIGFTLMAKYSPISIEYNNLDMVDGLFNISLGAKFSF